MPAGHGPPWLANGFWAGEANGPSHVGSSHVGSRHVGSRHVVARLIGSLDKCLFCFCFSQKSTSVRGASAKMKENELQKENSFSLKMLSFASFSIHGAEEQSSMNQHADTQLSHHYRQRAAAPNRINPHML